MGKLPQDPAERISIPILVDEYVKSGDHSNNDVQSTGDTRMEWNSGDIFATLFNTQPKIMKLIIEKQGAATKY